MTLTPINTSFLIFFSILISCGKRTLSDPPETGISYFPTITGQYIVYEADSFFYDDDLVDSLDITGSQKFLLKILYEGEFTDSAGKKAMRMEFFRKNFNPDIPYDLQDWLPNGVGKAIRTNRELLWQEGNEYFLKLIFPMVEGKSWNGNAYNYQDQWEYRLVSKGTPYISKMSFGKTAVVEQTGIRDLILYDQFGKEIYAEGIGLVYRVFNNLLLHPDTSGYRISMEAIEVFKP